MYIRAFEVFGSSGFVHFHKLRYFINHILKITIIFTLIAISEPNNALIPFKICFVNCFVCHNQFTVTEKPSKNIDFK